MEQKQNSQTLVGGALLLSLSGLIAKLFGALYRIPLTNIIGSYGMGLYQLVFPPYILVLTLAGCGIPVAMTKLIAENNQLQRFDCSRRIFRSCRNFLFYFGFAGTVFLICFARLIAAAQGNESTALAFVLIAPSVLFVTLSGALKGYFQGHLNMLPSAVTSIVEQLVKLVIGLLSAYLFMPNVEKAVFGMVLGITVSEFVSLVMLFIWYLKKRKVNNVQLRCVPDNKTTKSIFALAIPVALGSFVMQLSQVIDSVMVVNLITLPNATSLYGLWTGPVNSMLGLPVALSSGIAVTALPNFSKAIASKNSAKVSETYSLAIKLTLSISLPCALGLICLSNPILNLLYSALPKEEIATAATLLSVSGISVVFLSLLSTSIALLQANGKPFVSVVVVACAIFLKGIINFVLLPLPSVNVYGAAISETICYLFASFAVIIYTRKKLSLAIKFEQTVKPVACASVMSLALTALTVFAKDFVFSVAGTLITILLAMGVYLAFALMLKVFSADELGNIARLRKKEKNEGKVEFS